MKTWIHIAFLTTLMGLSFSTTGWASMSIEQGDYFFKMDGVKVAEAQNFVIGEYPDHAPLRPPAATVISTENSSMPAMKTTGLSSTPMPVADNQIPFILFGLNSSALPEKAAETILQVLEQKVSRSTPLMVTGFTCDLGTQEANDQLALHRAQTVAGLLESHGYVVPKVIGCGKRDYVTIKSELRHLNRRVEIMPLPPYQARNQQ